MTDTAAGTRHRRWAALGVAVAVVALRLPAVIADPVVSNDEAIYLRLAALAPAHPGVVMQHAYHPLYPALLVPMVAIGGEGLARLASVALAVLAAWLVFALARERAGPRTGVLAALAFAVLPGPVEGGAHVWSEAPYVPALVAAVWALLWAVRTADPRAFAACGAAAGAAYLCRPEGMAPLVVALAAAAAPWWREAGGARPGLGRRLAGAAAALGAFALLAGPYMAAIGGLTRKKRGTGFDAPAGTATADDPLALVEPSWIGSSDLPSGERQALAEWLHEWLAGVSPLLLALLVLGAVRAIRDRARPTPADQALAGCVAVFVALHVWLLLTAGYLSSRHVWPVACLLLPWAGVALDRLSAWRPARFARAGPLAALAVGLAALAVGAHAAAWPARAGRAYLRQAGLALRPRAGPAVGVLAADARVPYYADARPLVVGRTSLRDLLGSARAQGARFLAADASLLAARVEGWTEPPAEGAALVAAYEIPSRSGGTAGRFVVWDLDPEVNEKR